MDFTKVTCSAPGCGKNLAPLPPEAVWLPEVAAMRRANGGRPVEIADFVKFALCGRCGHLLRKEGVRVFRFVDTLARAEKQEAQSLEFKPFAARFALKAGQREQKGGHQRRRYDGVGQGLSRLSKEDAAKRLTKERKDGPKTDTVVPPASEAEV